MAHQLFWEDPEVLWGQMSLFSVAWVLLRVSYQWDMLETGAPTTLAESSWCEEQPLHSELLRRGVTFSPNSEGAPSPPTAEETQLGGFYPRSCPLVRSPTFVATGDSGRMVTLTCVPGLSNFLPATPQLTTRG